MNEQTKESLIVRIAEKLAGGSVESAVVEDVMHTFCEEFSFDGGCVYEIDQFNRFQLREHVAFIKAVCKPDFSLQSFERLQFKANDVLTFHRGEDRQTSDGILNLFEAETATAIFLADEGQKICGMIALYRLSRSVKLDPAQEFTLKILLQMLGRYFQIRLYMNKLSFAQNTLESILDNTGIDIYVNDFYTHEILYVNKSMALPYGGKTDFYGHKCWEVLFPGQCGQCEFCPQHKLIDENGAPTKVYSWNYQRPFDGSWFRVFSAAFRWMDGRLAHVVSSADISENKRNEELIKYMAYYDTLTKLPNRRMLIETCENRLIQKKEKGFLLFFDIDGFKKINDRFGHDAGDEFLVQLGEFFNGIPLLQNNVFRNGGDEFVALLDGNINVFGIKNLLSFIHARFKKPWRSKNGDVECNASVGVASYPEDAVTTEGLLSVADQAMYEVKKSGGGNYCFGNEIQKKSS